MSHPFRLGLYWSFKREEPFYNDASFHVANNLQYIIQ